MMREVIALRTDTRAIVAAAKDEIITELGARLDESEVSNRQMVEALEGLQLQLQHLQASQTAIQWRQLTCELPARRGGQLWDMAGGRLCMNVCTARDN